MKPLQTQLELLRRANSRVARTDKRLAEEAMDMAAMAMPELPAAAGSVEEAIALESIIMRRERPVLAIRNNEPQLVFQDERDSEIWRARLVAANGHLVAAARAVGRVELEGGEMEWVGTGWLVKDNLIVTNRHVAVEFAMRSGTGFVFRMGMKASMDFLEEIDNPDELVFRLTRPVFIAASNEPDIAFFEVDLAAGPSRLATAIPLSAAPRVTENAATLGYPAFDSRIPEPDLMERIYGRVYNKKRLAPGGVTRVDAGKLLHNCTTLGGNSGSAVLDLDSGEAVGLHFSGSFLTTNYAVPSNVVERFRRRVRTGQVGPERFKAPARVQSRDLAAPSTVSIPLTLTISISAGAPAAARPLPLPRRDPDHDDEPIDGDVEAVAADYDDRTGYEADFLGEAAVVELPRIEGDPDDILEVDGDPEGVLRYEHFSVVMSRSRRMCLLSAVNIDGAQSRKTKRVGWKWDPRIPREQQIMQECYGSPPRFSRGHMTRREDPAWGDGTAARRGNEDSMHVTNATPQMQSFNAPIWLELEDYALQNAREDDMRVSVFTGPYFTPDDPEMYGVRIPVVFWKVIAFIHDETGELCATGYEMSQERNLVPEEFVFGQFASSHVNEAVQVPIAEIERRAGISFGPLREVDPMQSAEESIARPLTRLEQIRFL